MLLGLADLDQHAVAVSLIEPRDGEEAGLVRRRAPACCMLWVTMTIVYSLDEVLHQVLDRQRRDRVERRAGLVHQDHLGLDGDRPRDAEPLLLAAREREGVLIQLVLDLVPERGAAQDLLDPVVVRLAGR